MATAPSPTTSANADAALDEFIFHPDQFRLETIPRRLAPADVAAFIQKRFEKSTPLKATLQTEKAVDYYDLYEVCDHFKQLLNKREATLDDHLRSAALTRAIARAGTPADRTFAEDYYLHLVARAEATQLLEMLVGVFEALDGEADAKPLIEKLEKRKKTIEPQVTDTSQLKHELRKIEDLLDQNIPRAQGANTVKARVLGLKARRPRIDEEIKIYLGQQYGFREYLPIWAARRLRREVWGEQPEQQFARADDPAHRNELVDAFRRAFQSVDAVQKVSDDEKNFMKMSCVHAIEFFGGTLTPEEKELAQKRAGVQIDVLANE